MEQHKAKRRLVQFSTCQVGIERRLPVSDDEKMWPPPGTMGGYGRKLTSRSIGLWLLSSALTAEAVEHLEVGSLRVLSTVDQFVAAAMRMTVTASHGSDSHEQQDSAQFLGDTPRGRARPDVEHRPCRARYH